MKLFLIIIKGLSKLLAKANLWYEKLEEPKRFIVSIIYGFLPFMVFIGLGFYIIGLLWVAIFVMALLIWWIYGNLRNFLEC